MLPELCMFGSLNRGNAIAEMTKEMNGKKKMHINFHLELHLLLLGKPSQSHLYRRSTRHSSVWNRSQESGWANGLSGEYQSRVLDYQAFVCKCR